MVDSFAHLGVDWSRSWGLEVFWRFSVRSVESVRHINLHTFSRDSWKSQKEKKVRAFEQMFQSHNSTGIPKFVNANRSNQKSTTLWAFYWFFFLVFNGYINLQTFEKEKNPHFLDLWSLHSEALDIAKSVQQKKRLLWKCPMDQKVRNWALGLILTTPEWWKLTTLLYVNMQPKAM